MHQQSWVVYNLMVLNSIHYGGNLSVTVISFLRFIDTYFFNRPKSLVYLIFDITLHFILDF